MLLRCLPTILNSNALRRTRSSINCVNAEKGCPEWQTARPGVQAMLPGGRQHHVNRPSVRSAPLPMAADDQAVQVPFVDIGFLDSLHRRDSMLVRGLGDPVVLYDPVCSLTLGVQRDGARRIHEQDSRLSAATWICRWFHHVPCAPIAGRSMWVWYDGAILLGSHEVAKRTHRKIAFKGNDPVDMRSRTGYNVLTRDNELMF